MAEAFLNHSGSDKFTASSAGIESGSLNPVVVAAMKECGIDISNNKTKTVDDILISNPAFDYVITVCDDASAERCPVFPGPGKKLHWPFPDPSVLTGSFEEKLAHTRRIRDAIKTKVEEFINMEKA
jgi:arsenate reductase